MARPTAKRSAASGQAKFIHHAQAGGIETSVLDDGPARGTRIAWVNTGSPLRYKVLIDRGLDIAEAFHCADSLAWLSYGGVTAPQRAYDRGAEWLRSFPGGLVTSCGPLNVGAPAEDAGETLGLHGHHSNTPATVESIIQPDPQRGRLEFSITATVKTAIVFGPNVELRRTLSGKLGLPIIDIRDEIVNRGNAPAPHAWLLHINLGWPLVDEGARFVYKGTVTPRADSVDWFADPRRYKRVPAPSAAHRGRGEACAYVDPVAERGGAVSVGLVNAARRLGLKVSFNKGQFPRWANWQHFGPAGEYVTGIEPCNCGVEGRDVDRRRGWLDQLGPGEGRTYETRIEVLTGRTALAEFARRWGD